MVIDTFCFFNELDLLEARLNILDGVVDKFVLVEAELTQSQKEKPLFYKENMARFEKFKDKIVHVILMKEECPTNASNLWNMENFQRNAIKRGLERLNLSPKDIVMISDLDEIPRPEAVKFVANALIEDYAALSFDMSFHAYYVNMASVEKGWIGTVATKWETLSFIDPQDLRNQKDHLIRAENAGWHLSWCGGWERVYQKLISCIEPFDKSTVPSKEELKERFEARVKEGQFHLIEQDDNTVPLQIVSDDYIPEYFAKNKEKYPHLFA